MNISKKAVVIAILGQFELFMDDDDDEDCSVLQLGKMKNFYENTVPNLSDNQFKQHFRMTPTTFEDFLKKMYSVDNNRNVNVSVGHPEMPFEKQSLITIWFLANLECIRSVSDRFGVSKSTCWNVLNRTCKRILNINRSFRIICWPSRERALNIMTMFQRINGFEGVIGCIDGTHIKILPPKEHPNSYFNRKHFHSILLQGVCDHRKLFTHIYTGEPGSIHDNRLFEKSDLGIGIVQGEIDFPYNSHLGDLAYKLSEHLIVGFKNNGALTDRQKNFNRKLSQIRVTIENAFALLKGRFRRLKFIETVRLDIICLLLMSACILHNICVLNGDSAEDIINVEQEIEEERQLNYVENIDNNYNRLGIVKRNEIMNHL